MNEVHNEVFADEEQEPAWGKKGRIHWKPCQSSSTPGIEEGLRGGGGSSDSHLSKLWMMQPQHSPSQHPAGGRGGEGRGDGGVSVRAHVT